MMIQLRNSKESYKYIKLIIVDNSFKCNIVDTLSRDRERHLELLLLSWVKTHSEQRSFQKEDV